MANKKKTPAKKMSKSGMKKTKGGSFSFGSQAFNSPIQKVISTGPSSIQQSGSGGGEG